MKAKISVEVAPFSWLEEPAKDVINSIYKGIKNGVASHDIFNKYKSSHFPYIKEMVGKIKVLGMQDPIPLADLYYPTTVSTEIKRRLYSQEWHSISNHKEEHESRKNQKTKFDAAEQAEAVDRLVVLGGPGAGKTTFLKFLALAYSDINTFKSTKLKTSKLPFFVWLPDLAKSDQSLIEYLAAPIIRKNGDDAKLFIERSAEKGYCAILLDSLDEVPERDRAHVLEKINEFTKSYSLNKVIVSCRAADYKQVLQNFTEVEILKLNEVAVQKIVRSWFKSDRPMADRLIQVISSDTSISQLTETPLLLSLLCIQFRHDLVLPRRKVEVYKRCVEALLRDWDATRGFRRNTSYETLSDMHKERLFEHIAGEVSEPTLSYIWPDIKAQTAAQSYLARLNIPEDQAPSVLDEIERHHGIIERHSIEEYCFSHSSIQDFFLAKNSISRREEIQLVKKNLNDESWASVIEFICAIHPDPVEIFSLMKKNTLLRDLRNYPAIEKRAKLLYLMYRCLSTGPTICPNELRSANKHIVESIKNFCLAMASTGIYPMCAIGQSGVRHPYYFTNNRRQSLHNALLPYRKLTNEILVRPSPGFADSAFEECDLLIESSPLELKDVAVILNCSVPLSKSNPLRTVETLSRTSNNLAPTRKHLQPMIEESITFINTQIAKV